MISSVKYSFLYLLLTNILQLYCRTTKDPKVFGGRSVSVQLFEWKWTNIAEECERFLAPNGFAAVQVSPPNEHAVINKPYRPWWERYFPVSYKLISRSGYEEDFKDMVKRCNNVGVRIYVDVVIGQMSGITGVGSAGSLCDADRLFYPAVPYNKTNFNDKVEAYTKVQRYAYTGLPKLAVETQYVQSVILNYLNRLIDMGVAGFLISSAKDVRPNNIKAIVEKLSDLRADIFGTSRRPFIYQEVQLSDDDTTDNTPFTQIGRVIEYKYRSKLRELMYKKKGQRLKMANDFGKESTWGFVNSADAFVSIDNQYNQRNNATNNILAYFESRLYKIANAFMLAWPYGFVQLMSGYAFQKTDYNQGPPHDINGNTKDVILNSDKTCGNGWTCEHRWDKITSMVKFRNVAGSTQVENWWDNGNSQIAFSRGNKAFIAINNDEWAMNDRIQTGLPQGFYCDVLTGDVTEDNKCSGRMITVFKDGTALIALNGTSRINTDKYELDPVIAIHVESKLK